LEIKKGDIISVLYNKPEYHEGVVGYIMWKCGLSNYTILPRHNKKETQRIMAAFFPDLKVDKTVYMPKEVKEAVYLKYDILIFEKEIWQPSVKLSDDIKNKHEEIGKELLEIKDHIKDKAVAIVLYDLSLNGSKRLTTVREFSLSLLPVEVKRNSDLILRAKSQTRFEIISSDKKLKGKEIKIEERK